MPANYEKVAGSGIFEKIPNPLSIEKLEAMLQPFEKATFDIFHRGRTSTACGFHKKSGFILPSLPGIKYDFT